MSIAAATFLSEAMVSAVGYAEKLLRQYIEREISMNSRVNTVESDRVTIYQMIDLIRYKILTDTSTLG